MSIINLECECPICGYKEEIEIDITFYNNTVYDREIEFYCEKCEEEYILIYTL